MALKHVLATMGLMAASTAAFAETVTAKIGFPFQAGGKTFAAAAEHNIAVNALQSGAMVIVVTDPASKVSRMFVPTPITPGYAQGVQPKLVFNCVGDSACSLKEVHTTTGAQWLIRQRKLTPAEAERMTVVTVPARTVTAD